MRSPLLFRSIIPQVERAVDLGNPRLVTASGQREFIRSGHRSTHSTPSAIASIAELPNASLFLSYSETFTFLRFQVEVVMVLRYFLGLSTTAFVVVGLCTCGPHLSGQFGKLTDVLDD